MTTQLDSLRALHDAVKAGHVIDQRAPSFNDDLELLWKCFPTKTPPVSDAATRARWAWGGSLDAAHALHKAVLPKAIVSSADQDSARQWYFTLSEVGGSFLSHDGDANPARAWLLAILAALIAQAEAREGEGA